MAAQAKQVPFNDARWEPLDKAAELKGKVSADGVSLTHTLVGGTDWWRTTERHSTNGPARGFYVDGKRDFEISVDITVHPEVQVSGRSPEGPADSSSAARDIHLTPATRLPSSCTHLPSAGSKPGSSTTTTRSGTARSCATPTLTGGCTLLLLTQVNRQALSLRFQQVHHRVYRRRAESVPRRGHDSGGQVVWAHGGRRRWERGQGQGVRRHHGVLSERWRGHGRVERLYHPRRRAGSVGGNVKVICPC